MRTQRIAFTIFLTMTIGLFFQTAAPVAFGQKVVITVDRGDNEPQGEPFRGVRPAADMAILLDTSNSMDGLINQAKSQLWTIVQQFAKAKKDGKTPLLRVAVFEYGNTNLPASEGYIRQVTGLTDDLDKVSEALFGLTTNGGDEYCGQVIAEALKRLDWTGEPNGFKAIFIAGNEPFTQGDVDYHDSCKKAIQSGIVVNTIHCGDYSAGVSGKWKEGADLAEGQFLNINQDKAVVAIQTPQDRILIELNEKLNRTYLWYGQKDLRLKFESNQTQQDENALKQQGAAGLSSRANVKAGSLYSNVGRDLVDSWNNDKKVLDELDKAELPESLQQLDRDGLEALVQQKLAERKAIQKQIAEINQQRVAYIADAKKNMPAPASDGSTLGDAIESAIDQQLSDSGFEIDK